jgi:four helix bundle protein
VPVHNYKELKVWQKSRMFVKEVYITSADFPKDERFGVVSQIRRAAISISLNIAEGSGRVSDKDFLNFLHIAYGSSLEVENLIILSFDLEFITEHKQLELLRQVNEIQRMLKGLMTSLK